MTMPDITTWTGTYRDGWQEGDICPAAFAHPAKVAKGLAFRIIRHLITQGYVQAGALCIDPFAGIGGFALPCLSYGLRWVGVELEPRFVDLAQQNLALWHRRYGFAGGTVVQGDSRQLRSVLAGVQAGCMVGSPPYAACDNWRGESKLAFESTRQAVRGRNPNGAGLLASCSDYGSSPGQLGALPTGTPPACVLGSPPFSVSGCQPTGRGQGVRSDYRNGLRAEASPESTYGTTPGQLGALPPGTPPACVVGSPPYAESLHGKDVDGVERAIATGKHTLASMRNPGGQLKHPRFYGDTEGQLGALPPGTPPACVLGSPPFATGDSAGPESLHRRTDKSDAAMRQIGGWNQGGGQTSPNNLAALPTGTPPAAIVSSPPYAESAVSALDATSASGGQGNAYRRTGKSPRARKAMVNEQYQADAVISSPPYAGAGQVLGTHNGIDWSKAQDGGKESTPARVASGEGYGRTPGQLGNMAIVSSPPYGDQEDKRGKIDWAKTHHGSRAAAYGTGQSSDADGCAGYGVTPGQLGAMPPGAVVSSPPYEAQVIRARDIGKPGFLQGATQGQHSHDAYGTSPAQLGNTTGDTFWSAASQIVSECAALLPVGGIACWVVKGYVSKGKLVDFPAQWLALCEHHGFRLVKEIHASLVEDHGTQEGLFGEAETVQTERKSFFRRLHERKPGAVRIDHETILILEKL